MTGSRAGPLGGSGARRSHARGAFLGCIALVGCQGHDESARIDEAALIAGVDLTVTAFAPPATVASRELVTFSWTVTDNGMTAATATTVACCAEGWGNTWADAIYLSSDATWSSDDVLVDKVWRPSVATLASGASYAPTASLQMPTVAPGAYYLIAYTDALGNRVGEASDDNNTLAVAVTITRADLGVTAATVPASAGAQQLVTLGWTVDNHGSGAASGLYVPCCAPGYFYLWEDAAFLSTDATLSTDDIKFATLPRDNQYKLAAGASYSASGAFQLPNVESGSYQILIVTDSAGNRVDESDETDNVLVRPITIGKADLTVSALTAPATAGTGELVPVSYTVANLGDGGATGRYVACCGYGYFYTWEDAVYLSTDATLSTDDVKLATVLRADSYTLAAGASYSATMSVQVPVVPPGDYYVLVQTDSAADRVAEDSESNNIRASAAPISIGHADLAVSAITVPSNPFPGAPVALAWTVVNSGTHAAAGRYQSSGAAAGRRWEDAIYLSRDAVLGSDDTLLGTRLQADGFTLAAGASYTAAVATTLPATASGSYYLLAIVDAGDRVPESDETNDVRAVAIAIAPPHESSTTAAPGCDQFPNRVEDDNCEQNCCAEDDICSVEHDCAGAGAGTQACTSCRDHTLVCAGYCVAGMTDCAASACGCGRSLCYSTACAAGRASYCARNCDLPLNDICDAPQHPGKAMLGATAPVTAIPDTGSQGYRFTPNKPGTAVALGGLFAGTRTVRLYRYSTGAQLASVTHPSSGTFGYTPVAPVPLQAGITYVVAVDLAGGEGARTATAQPVPGEYLNLTIDCAGTSGVAAAMPSSCSSTYKGMADVEIDFGP